MPLFGPEYKGDHPKDVARAFYELKKDLARSEGNAEEQQWRDMFDSAKLQGLPPSAAQGFQAPGQSPLERWESQINGLIESGNPVLQKQGLDMISQFQNRATAPESKTDTRTNDIKNWLMARTPEGGGFEGTLQDWIQQNKTKMYQSKLTSVPDSKSLRVRPESMEMWQDKYGRTDVAPGMDMQEIAPHVYTVDPARAEEARAAGAVAAEFNDALFNPETGIYNDWGPGLFNLYKEATSATAQKFIQNDPRIKQYEDARNGFVALLAKSLGESGNLAIQDVERAKKLIPTITLPVPDSPAVARMKLDMLNRIIAANDSGDYASAKKLIDDSDAKLKTVQGLPEGFELEEEQ